MTIPMSTHSKLQAIRETERLRSISQVAERLIRDGVEGYDFDQGVLPLPPGRRQT